MARKEVTMLEGRMHHRRRQKKKRPNQVVVFDRSRGVNAEMVFYMFGFCGSLLGDKPRVAEVVGSRAE